MRYFFIQENLTTEYDDIESKLNHISKKRKLTQAEAYRRAHLRYMEAIEGAYPAHCYCYFGCDYQET